MKQILTHKSRSVADVIDLLKNMVKAFMNVQFAFAFTAPLNLIGKKSLFLLKSMKTLSGNMKKPLRF